MKSVVCLLFVLLSLAPNVFAIEIKEAINPPPLRDRLVHIEKMMKIWSVELKEVKASNASNHMRIKSNEVILSGKSSDGPKSLSNRNKKVSGRIYSYYR
jgi:hypothetical protein